MAPSTPSSPSLKVALALALLRHRRHPLSPPPSSSAADPDPLLHWKRKAKDRKRELMRLREELKLLQDGVRCEDERPPIASCRCHFFDGCGDGAGGGHWIDEVLRRRFLRLVRWKERRKRVDGSIRRRSFIEFNNENEIERFGTSIEFLVELSDNIMGKGEYDSSFSTFCHQAVDFILASLKNIISSQKESELLEEMANGLIMRLMKRMCTMNDSKLSSDSFSDSQFCIQHLIRKLGNEAYFGQRILLSVSEKISIVAESFLFTDPFDDTFPGMHDSMFMMIQLVEFLILDYIKSWMSDERFDKKLFEEWVRSILKARKDLELLENMNGLYTLYMERAVGKLAKELGPVATQGMLDIQVSAIKTLLQAKPEQSIIFLQLSPLICPSALHRQKPS
ncbi:protein MULTIPOLAR SPINDLE 1 isoform X2 [Ananas comosus]|uniref:Protein MULTIPOLAR SPINDLE 1 isoform X2 n=1 Tax=Ananas comosus TaxID=4615 RepID=A0A6P5G6G3_ANACO|nr:protein MULTIPOLAR SPINDLE 1 isoform X2 [Ananas comosus]